MIEVDYYRAREKKYTNDIYDTIISSNEKRKNVNNFKMNSFLIYLYSLNFLLKKDLVEERNFIIQEMDKCRDMISKFLEFKKRY